MLLAKSTLHIENYNNDFLIVKSVDRGLLSNAGRSIFESQFDFADEVIVTEEEVCIKLNNRFDESKLIELNNFGTTGKVVNRAYKLPVYFEDSDDWSAVVAHSGMEKEEVVSIIIKTELSVTMLGFLPGFVYLDGLDPALHIPRKTIPSKYVKANSIAIGGKYLGVYSINSPGGWYVIGQIPMSILNMEVLPPIDFNIGDTIQLESIAQDRFDEIAAGGFSFKEYNA